MLAAALATALCGLSGTGHLVSVLGVSPIADGDGTATALRVAFHIGELGACPRFY